MLSAAAPEAAAGHPVLRAGCDLPARRWLSQAQLVQQQQLVAAAAPSSPGAPQLPHRPAQTGAWAGSCAAAWSTCELSTVCFAASLPGRLSVSSQALCCLRTGAAAWHELQACVLLLLMPRCGRTVAAAVQHSGFSTASQATMVPGTEIHLIVVKTSLRRSRALSEDRSRLQ